MCLGKDLGVDLLYHVAIVYLTQRLAKVFLRVAA